jgi:hypothetical protein
VVEIEGTRNDSEQAPVQVQREEEKWGEELVGKLPESRGVEEVPEGPMGEEIAEMMEVVVRPPETEDGAVEQPCRPAEGQQDRRLGEEVRRARVRALG